VKFTKILLLLYLSFAFFDASAQIFDFNSYCKKAYNHIIALRIDSAKYLIENEKKIQPNNYIPYLLYNYIDFLEIYTSGSLLSYETKKKQMDARLLILKNGNSTSPYFLYSQAEVHTQSAVLHIKFGEYFASVLDLRKAIKKLEENQLAFPNFTPNKKSLGMLYTILGSIPQEYQSTLDLIGLDGSVSKGLKLLKIAVDDVNHPFQHEAATIYAFMLLHIQNKPEEAWTILKNNQFSSTKSLMDAYALGHIGIYGLHNDEGINALIQRPTGKQYATFPLCNFLLGMGKTYRQDTDANLYFSKFLEQNKGEDYVKSAWHKMAWNALISGDETSYKLYILNVAKYGRAVIDTDKQAEKEANSSLTPNVVLLKARLLTDGNYLTKALTLLEQKTVNFFISKNEKTEYYYRLARIYDKSKLYTKAIQYYEITISNGKNVPHYFAANAAYLMGFLYEQKLDKEAAIASYEQCLELNGYEYENSIHQKAEAALNRLKN
jgi:hypothetical protein